MIEKELKIRDTCGYYALDIPNYNGSNFTLLFNSKKNAENAKRIIEIDESKPNEAPVCVICKKLNTVSGYLKKIFAVVLGLLAKTVINISL